MNAEFTKGRAEMLNNFAASGGAVLAATGKDAAVAALPDTNPPLFAAVGTVEGIRKVLLGEQAAEPVGVVGTMPGTDGFTMACFKASEVPVGTKLYLAAHLASQSQAATIPCCGDPNCYDCDRVPVKVAAPTQASTAQVEELKRTDLSKHLRAAATADVSYADARLLIGAAEEIDRYYTGMLNWKRTAEAKDEVTVAQGEQAAQSAAATSAWLVRVHDDVLEQAAKACDEVIFDAGTPEESAGAVRCRDAIRALRALPAADAEKGGAA